MKFNFLNKNLDSRITAITIMFIIVFSLLLQLLLIPRLPDKYFYDSMGIISIANGTAGSIYFDGSYMLAGNFYRIINIFGFTTFKQWGIFLSLLFSVVSIIYFSKYKKISLFFLIYSYATIALANMYIFRISKDAIQFIMWIITFIIIMRSNLKLNNLVLLTLFIIEGYFFRSYYIAIGILMLIINYILNKQKKINIKKLIIIGIIGIFISLLICQFLAPQIYNKIINLRFLLNGNRLESADAITIINDIFPNTNPFLYIINYAINLLRILFPIELILKGGKYLLFAVYQIVFSILLFKSIKAITINRNKRYIYLVSTIIAYLLVVNLFEPDFGSVIRHQCCLFFIYLAVFNFNNYKVRGDSDEKVNNSRNS